jgi:hypothetical protein
MKHMVFFLIVFLAAGASAQDKPAAPQPEPGKGAATEAAKEKPKQATAAPRMPVPRRWKEDARHCLERPTNTEVIKCAEEYL